MLYQKGSFLSVENVLLRLFSPLIQEKAFHVTKQFFNIIIYFYIPLLVE